MTRQPGLDGIRGVAILLVVACHSVTDLQPLGAVGVTVFFVLSGYLITGILLGEQDRHGALDLSAFYARRARRLLPALVVFLAAMLTLGLTVHPGFASPGAVLAALLYVGNWTTMVDGIPPGLGHIWSLAIEEQFYILFPLLAVGLARRRHLFAVALAALIVASVAWRLWLWRYGPDTWGRVYLGTDTTAFTLLTGGLLATLQTQCRPTRVTSAACLAGLIALAALPMSHAQQTWAPILATALTVPLILGASDLPLLTSSWLRLVGQRSYALYLWHVPILWADGFLVGPRLIMVPIALALAWGVTLLSWRYVEEPFLRRTPYRATSRESATHQPTAAKTARMIRPQSGDGRISQSS